TSSPAVPPPRCRSNRGDRRQRHGEAGTAGPVGGGFDAAAMVLDDALAHAQSQVAAPADRLGGGERLEEPLRDGGVEPGSVVRDLEPYGGALVPGGHVDGRLGRVMDRVNRVAEGC